MAYTISNDYEMASPKKARAFMMPLAEWNYLCRSFRSITDESIGYKEWAFLFFGILVSTLIEVIKDPESILFCCVATGSLIAGSLCLGFAMSEGASRAKKVSAVIEFVEHIDERFNQFADQGLSKLHIVSAIYACGDKKVDATEAVREMISNDCAEILSGNHLAGDPLPGQGKALTIIYTFESRKRTCIVPEGQTVTLPE